MKAIGVLWRPLDVAVLDPTVSGHSPQLRAVQIKPATEVLSGGTEVISST